ncbi:MAG TPA: aspartyl/asparaginyl beta-hydroxylase domain-containing protein [Balneolaceae bacterium]|nr:aspartyl/asparaginyl beta-hydroxylase domain-containing protein [Balneolaceae bacterium]
MSNATMSFKQKRKKIVKDFGGKLLWGIEKIMEKYSKVPTTPFLDPTEFPWTRRLEDNWKVIRDELDEILKNKDAIPNFQDISEDQKALTEDNNWKTYFLYGFGYKAEQNCARCPKTTKLVESVPGMTTAFFSILEPGKHIPHHRGVYKGFMRYHLGLLVPEPKEQCRIRVEDTYAHWEEGKGIMFDDTYDHEVWNDTNGIRVVLFMDVIRPMSFPASLINKAIIGAIKHTGYIQDAKKNQEAWEEKFVQKSQEKVYN